MRPSPDSRERVPRVPREQERRGEEQRDQRVPAVLGELGDRRDVLEARVRDHRVEPAVALERGRRRPRGCPRGSSGRRRRRRPRARPTRRSRRRACDRRADPAGRAGDERYRNAWPSPRYVGTVVDDAVALDEVQLVEALAQLARLGVAEEHDVADAQVRRRPSPSSGVCTSPAPSSLSSVSPARQVRRGQPVGARGARRRVAAAERRRRAVARAAARPAARTARRAAA